MQVMINFLNRNTILYILVSLSLICTYFSIPKSIFLQQNIETKPITITPSQNYSYVNEVKAYKAPVMVYNLTIADNHDYFVGNKNVLVHNGDPCVFNELLRSFETQSKLMKDEAMRGINRLERFKKPNGRELSSGFIDKMARMLKQAQTTNEKYEAELAEFIRKGFNNPASGEYEKYLDILTKHQLAWKKVKEEV